MHTFLTTLLLSSTFIIKTYAQAGGATCLSGSKCPEDLPCCSQYGNCGTGALCLLGCDPKNSFSPDACLPVPMCQDKTYDFKDMSKIVSSEEYLGDPSTADWVASGAPLQYNGDQLLLTMKPNTVGTLIISTQYFWYGKVSARMKTSRGQGVVSAFVTMSDVRDEIDYEMVGADLMTAQNNYFWQGDPLFVNGGNQSLNQDSYNNFHLYEIDWQPDQITWSVDGVAGRTRRRNDTWNSTGGHWQYPQTPARIQFSIWPAGDPSQPPGTIAWAGGLIDWNSPDIQQYGYDFMVLESVTLECSTTVLSTAGNGGTRSYKWSTEQGVLGLNNSIILSNDNTTIASLVATGTNRSATLDDGDASLGGLGSSNFVDNAQSGGGSADSSRGGNATDNGDMGTSFVQGGDATALAASSSMALLITLLVCSFLAL